MSWTALACTRNERPTRTAGSSPLCTKRYTVIFDTRINAATSDTVRNWDLPALPSATTAAVGSIADGPFVDFIATQSSRHGSPSGFPTAGTTARAYKRRIAGLMGSLIRVWMIILKPSDYSTVMLSCCDRRWAA